MGTVSDNPWAWGRNGASPPQRGLRPRGQSALDVVIEAGVLPFDAGPLEFSVWLQGPAVDAALGLTLLVQTEVTAQNAPTLAAAAASAAAASNSKTAAAASKASASGFATAAAASKVSASNYATAAAASAAVFVKATVTQVWTAAAAASNKYIPATVQAASAAFVAADAAEIAANVWTPDCARGFNRGPYVLAANTTIAKPTNMKDGVTYVFDFVEDATGGRTLTINAVFDFGTGENTINTGANKRNRILATYVASYDKFIATLHKSA